MNKQYSDADIVQLALARHYEGEHGASVVSVGNAPAWDIKFKDGKTMEVKLDASALQYGNAAVEFWDDRRNKPTGILETQADLWIHCIPEGEGLRCHEVDTKRLQKLCLESGDFKLGGDKKASHLKLIPLGQLKEIANSDFLLESELVKFIRYW